MVAAGRKLPRPDTGRSGEQDIPDPFRKRLCAVRSRHGKVADRKVERIVHHSVKHSGTKPRRALLPYFADDVRLRVCVADTLFELLQKAEAHLVRHIQPPGVDAVFPRPFRGSPDEIRLHGRVFGVPLRHIRGEREALKGLYGTHSVRRQLRRCFASQRVHTDAAEPVEECRLLPVFQNILPERMLPGGVVIYAVEHNAHAVFVQCTNERGKVLLRSEHRVDARIVCGVVPVIGRALEYGIEIHPLHAE